MIDREKYRQVILYFLHECNNEHLGRVKLMKLLYYLDFDYFGQHRTSVTGDKYRRLEHGPVPVHADAILQEMECDALITSVPAQRGPFSQTQYVPRTTYNLSALTAEEVTVLKAVTERWRDATRAEIEDASHREQPWIATPENRDVSFVHAFHRKANQPVSDNEKDAIIREIVQSQAIEGIDLSPDEVAALFHEVFPEPDTALSD